jgi:copper homeostasis protein
VTVATARVDLEIAVESARGARTARQSGADRVELCQALELGGLGPTAGQIEAAVRERIPVHVLVRPRPGDFVYDSDEISSMVINAGDAIRRGAAGVVVGALTAEGRLDRDVIRRLTDAAHDAGRAQITVHRAIDRAADPVRETARLADLGIDRVLTSGGGVTVGEGIASGALHRMISVAGPIDVMAGGGLVPADVDALLALPVSALHLSAARASPPRGDGSSGPSSGHRVTDGELIAAMRARIG